MGRKVILLILCLGLILMPLPGQCTEIDLSAPHVSTETPRLCPLSDVPLLETSPIDAACGAMMLLEMDSGQVIFASNADSPRSVASVTKVMTLLLALEMLDSGRLTLDMPVTISKAAAGMGGSQVLLDVGESQAVEILLKSIIVGSANDAAVALAETMYGSEAICVDQMNQRAEALGMTGTHFVNCTGLPADGQHTTAHDVAIMAREMFAHPLYFEYAQIWLDEVDHGDGRITQLTNTNKLIRLYDGCDGGKTGSTREAGYCVAATAQRGDMRLIAIVLGASDSAGRFDIASRMFDYGFANYRRYPVVQKGTAIKGQLPVTGGTADGVNLILDGDLTLLVLKGTEQAIQLQPHLPESLAAPIAAGEVAGHLSVVIEGRTVAEIPVVTGHAIASKGIAPSLKRLIRHWVL